MIADGESSLQTRPLPERGWPAFIACGLQRISTAPTPENLLFSEINTFLPSSIASPNPDSAISTTQNKISAKGIAFDAPTDLPTLLAAVQGHESTPQYGLRGPENKRKDPNAPCSS
jgi:hypothetical protein